MSELSHGYIYANGAAVWVHASLETFRTAVRGANLDFRRGLWLLETAEVIGATMPLVDMHPMFDFNCKPSHIRYRLRGLYRILGARALEFIVTSEELVNGGNVHRASVRHQEMSKPENLSVYVTSSLAMYLVNASSTAPRQVMSEYAEFLRTSLGYIVYNFGWFAGCTYVRKLKITDSGGCAWQLDKPRITVGGKSFLCRGYLGEFVNATPEQYALAWHEPDIPRLRTRWLYDKAHFGTTVVVSDVDKLFLHHRYDESGRARHRLYALLGDKFLSCAHVYGMLSVGTGTSTDVNREANKCLSNFALAGKASKAGMCELLDADLTVNEVAGALEAVVGWTSLSFGMEVALQLIDALGIFDRSVRVKKVPHTTPIGCDKNTMVGFEYVPSF